MAVEYKDNNISINLSNLGESKSISVYAHPNDKLSFNLDISNLRKEIIKGDLIIHLLNGKTVTVVNFGLMALDNQAPSLVDATGNEYTPFSLFQGAGYFSGSGVPSYVVSRQVSSPDDQGNPKGESLPTSKDLQEGEGLESSKSGSFPVEDQNPVPEFGPSFQDYVQKTLRHIGTRNNISETNFSSTKGFKYTDKSDDTQPVKLLIINPKFNPEYGASSSLGEKDSSTQFSTLKVGLGGGHLKGTDYLSYLYSPEKISVANATSNVYYDGMSQGDVITRYVTIYIDNKLVRFTDLTVGGLPNGVTVPTGSFGNLQINPIGGGSYQIDINGGSSSGEVEIPVEYKVGSVEDEAMFAPFDVSYNGVLTTTGDIVKGSSVFYVYFLPVQSESDIQGGYNSYTFSTLRDPLLIVFPNSDNEIIGGKGNYTYVGGTGADTAVGGEATEVFNLGSGDNKFYAGVYNDTVTNNIQTGDSNFLYLSDAIDKADTINNGSSNVTSTKVVIDNGEVTFSGKRSGTDFESKMTNFTDIDFDTSKYSTTLADRDNTLFINSTKYLSHNITAHFADGNNIVKLGGANGNTINLGDLPNYAYAFVSESSSNTGVYLDWENSSGDNWVVGSNVGDKLSFGENANSIKYDGSHSARSVADYSGSKNTAQFVYDAFTGLVSRGTDSGNKEDKLLGISEITGGAGGENVFYGATYYTARDKSEQQANIHYVGGHLSSALNTLSYENLKSLTDADRINNGVTIDMDNKVVHKNLTQGEDSFENIGKVVASDNNDIIIAANEAVSSDLDGKGGDNTIDYSKFSNSIKIDISDYTGTSQVTKSGNISGQDSLKNFNKFYGSMSTTEFVLTNDYDLKKQGDLRFTLVGSKLNATLNSVSYASSSGNAILLDLNSANEYFTASVYNGNDTTVYVKNYIDNLKYINTFILSDNANNVIKMYTQNQLGYTINAGSGGDNKITFSGVVEGVELDFKSSNYSNIVNVQTLILSDGDDKVIMGSNFFATLIDGGKGVNTIDLSIMTTAIDITLDLDNVSLNNLQIGTKNITAKNFQKITATSVNDVFGIKADLNNIDAYTSKGFYVDGNEGSNTISFKDVFSSDQKVHPVSLNIDLSKYEDVSVVTDLQQNELMSFKNFSTIIGSEGDDVFVLPDYTFNFQIDGGNGTNTVSYEAYEKGVFITQDTLSRFTNIQKILGSQGDDKISLNKDTNLMVDGGKKGFNKAIFSGDFSSVSKIVVNYSQKTLSVTKGANVDTLSNIQYVNFKNILPSGSNKPTSVIVNITDPALDNSRDVYFAAPVSSSTPNGGAVSLKYTNADSFANSVKLNLSLKSSVYAEGNWIALQGLDSNQGQINFQDFSQIDMEGYMSISLTDYTSLIASLQNINSLTIDNKNVLQNSLNLEQISGDVNVRGSEFTESYPNANGSNFDLTIKEIGEIRGSNDISSTLNYIAKDPVANSQSSQSVIIYAGLGQTNINYAAIKSALDLTLAYDTSGIAETIVNASVVGGSGGSNIEVQVNSIYGNITEYQLSTSANNSVHFKLNEDAKGVRFNATGASSSVVNSVEYSSPEAPRNSYDFNIKGNGEISVSRHYGENVDTYLGFYDVSLNIGKSNIIFDDSILSTTERYDIRTKVPGGAKDVKDATFDLSNVNNSSLIFEMQDSANSGKLNINASNTAKASVYFDTSSDLLRNEITLKGSGNSQNTFKLGYFFGGVFSVSNSNTFNLNIYGNNVATNVLDLTDYKGDLTLSAAVASIKASGSSNLTIYANKGVQNIFLGNGDNTIEISSSVSSDWQQITGGTGTNVVSFAHMQAPVRYDLGVGFQDGASSLKLVNFNGVLGSDFNDTFFLNDKDSGIKGTSIDGGLGSLNELDYSDLKIAITVNAKTGQVTRGTAASVQVDNVQNIQVFKGGIGGTDFISDSAKGIYSFVGGEKATNSLSYQSSIASTDNLTFNFNSASVSKVNGDYDSFSNISKFYGGYGENNFIFATEIFQLNNVSLVELHGVTGKGELSTINLSQALTANATRGVVYDIYTNIFRINQINVQLFDVQNFIGTRLQDIYKFSDTVDGFRASGSNNDIGKEDIIDLTNVTKDVKVDFKSLTIEYNNKTNSFVQIGIFKGSSAALNTFSNLSYFQSYDITGNSSKANVVTYEDSSLSMNLRVSSASLTKALSLDKSGITDNLDGIKSLTLSGGLNAVYITDEDALTKFQNFDLVDLGKGGNNLLKITHEPLDSKFSLDLSTNKFTSEGSSYSTDYANKIRNFNKIEFEGDKSSNKAYFVKLAASFGDLKEITFTGGIKTGYVDLSLVSSDLSINMDASKTTRIIEVDTNNSLLVSHINKLIFGSKDYTLNYNQFGNTNMSSVQIDTSNAASTTLNVNSFDNSINSAEVTQQSNDAFEIKGLKSGGQSITQNYTSLSKLLFNDAPNSFNLKINNLQQMATDKYIYINNSNKNSASIIVDLTPFSGKELTMNFSVLNIVVGVSNKTYLNAELLSKSITINSVVTKPTFVYTDMPLTKYVFNDSKANSMSIDMTTVNYLPSGITYTFNHTKSSPSSQQSTLDITSGNTQYLTANTIAGQSLSNTIDITLSNYNSSKFYLSGDGIFINLSGSRNSLYSNTVVTQLDNTSNLNIEIDQDHALSVKSGNTVKSQVAYSTSSTTSGLINNIQIQSNNSFKEVKVKVYSDLKNVDFGTKLGGSSVRLDTLDFSNYNQNNISGVIDLGLQYLSGTFKGSGNLSFSNFFYGGHTSGTAGSKITLSNISNSIDNIVFTSNYSMIELFTNPANKLFLDIGYTKSLSSSQSSFDFSSVRFNNANTTSGYLPYFSSDGSGMNVYFRDSHMYTSVQGDPSIRLSDFYKIKVQLSDANANNNGAYIIYDGSNSTILNLEQSVDLGNMNSMNLPSKYQIFVKSAPPSDISSSELWKGGDATKIQSYNSFYNAFVFSGTFSGVITANLFQDSSNSSTFSVDKTNGKYQARGINLIWGSDKQSTNVSISKVETASKFAVLLFEHAPNFASSDDINNSVDFKTLTDAGGYRFYMAQKQDATLRTDTSYQVILSNKLKYDKGGLGEVDNNYAYYGTISGFTKLTLTFGNDWFIPLFDNRASSHVANSSRYIVDGDKGINTLNFANDEVSNDSITFGSNGFVYNNITYQNFKEIINPASSTNMTYTVNFNNPVTDGSIHNYVIKNFDDKNAPNLGGKVSINHVSGGQSSSATYLFLNNDSILASSAEANTASLLFKGIAPEHFSLNNPKILFSDHIDFSLYGYVSGFTYKTIYVTNDNTGSGSTDVDIYLSQNNTNVNYKVEAVSTSIVYIKEIDAQSGLSFLIQNPNGNINIHHNLSSGGIDASTIDYLNGLSDLSNNYASDVDYSGASKFNSEGYKLSTSSNGVHNMEWISENKYLESSNHYYANEEYWKSLDKHIYSVVSGKEDSKTNTNAFLEELYKQQSEKSKNVSDDSESKNTDHKDNSSDNKEASTDNSKEDKSSNTDNKSDNNSNDQNPQEAEADNKSASNKDENVHHANDHFDLNAVLQAAKDMHSDSHKNDTNLLEELGFKNISHEILEDTYKQDEANSMGYTIDTSHNYSDSYGDANSASSHQDNQKNKIDHH